MFGWFSKRKKASPETEIGARFNAHFDSAQGSYLERSSVAAALSAIEDQHVQRRRTKLPAEEQLTFMIVYECMVMWSLGRGMETVLDQKDLESAITAIQASFAKHGWYQQDAVEKIWDQMQSLMPMAMRSEPGGPPPYPLAEMSMAAHQAGYPLNIPSDLTFGIHVVRTIAHLSNFGQATAKRHLELSRK